MGNGGVWARVGGKWLYFCVEPVRRVWHVPGLLCTYFINPAPEKNMSEKNKLVVERMSKYDCPEGIAGS